MKGRSKSVMENQAVAAARRAEVAAAFRAQLLAELGGTPTTSQLALIDVATSAYAESQELSALFLRCKTTDDDMTRLGLARGQLARVLRALGLPNGSGADPDGAIDVPDLIRRYTTKPKEDHDGSTESR